MRLRISSRFDAAIADIPLWLAAAACLALLLLANAVAQFRGPAAAPADSATVRAVEIARALELREPSDGSSLTAWLDRIRRASNGEIAWLRLLGRDGSTEARSGAVIVRVRWENDERIQAGRRSFQIVEAPSGRMAVAAVPLSMHSRRRNSRFWLASLGAESAGAKILEIGAPSASAHTAREWVSLFGAAILSALMLSVMLTRGAKAPAAQTASASGRWR